jgi:hypothetical protein
MSMLISLSRLSMISNIFRCVVMIMNSYICCPNAQMAKLVDALPSGGSVRKDVLVRIQFWAQNTI